MSIVTKIGDKGETGLFSGKRVQKDDQWIEAIGALDELNAAVGALTVFINKDESIQKELAAIQEACFVIGGELATPSDAPEQSQAYIPCLKGTDLAALEEWLVTREATLSAQTKFILPGGCQAAALAFWVRAITRRAERAAVSLSRSEPINPLILQYLNRLSDYFFILARFFNQEANQSEIEWKGGR